MSNITDALLVIEMGTRNHTDVTVHLVARFTGLSLYKARKLLTDLEVKEYIVSANKPHRKNVSKTIYDITLKGIAEYRQLTGAPMQGMLFDLPSVPHGDHSEGSRFYTREDGK